MIRLIEDLQSGNNVSIKQAENALSQQQLNNIPGFCLDCCKILTDANLTSGSRQLAGTLLRRTVLQNINSKAGWDYLPKQSRQHIKHALLGLLVAPDKLIRRTSADNVSAICAVELPRGEWPDIVQSLVNNTANNNLDVKESAITTLSFVCELMKEKGTFVDEKSMETIFGGILIGLKDSDLNIKRLSLNAMTNSLSAGKSMFNEHKVREYTLNQLSETILNESDPSTKIAVLQTMAEFCRVIYQHMGAYLEGLCSLTFPLMTNYENSEVCQSAMEIWNSFLEEYLELRTGATQVQNLIVPELSKQLAQILMKNMCVVTGEDQEDEESSIRGTAYRTLCNLGETNANDFSQLVVNFVSSTIASKEWHERQASIKAFTSLLDGYDKNSLKNLISNALIEFLRLLEDNSQMVQLSAAYSLSKISETVPESFVTHHEFEVIIKILMGCLAKKVEVSKLICQVFQNLANYDGCSTSAQLNSNLDSIVGALIKNGMRTDVADGSLPCDSFLASMLLLNKTKNAAVCLKYIQLILQNFNPTYDIQPQTRRSAIHSGFLAILQSCITGSAAAEISQTMIEGIFKLVESYFQRINDVDTSGIYILSELSNVIPKSTPYIDLVWKYVMHALKRPQDSELFKATTILISDLSRFDPIKFSANIVIIDDLLKLFMDPHFSNECKLQILVTIGDLFLSCPNQAEPYLQKVLDVFQIALKGVMLMLTSMFEYGDLLRESLIESITSIMHATSSKEKQNPVLASHLPIFIEFVKLNTVPSAKPSLQFIRNTTLLCLDFIHIFGTSVEQYFKDGYISNALEILKKHNNQGEQNDVLDFAKVVLKIT